MSPARKDSMELRRLGRAGPTPSEMELLRAATLEPDAASAAWRRWNATDSIDDAGERSAGLLPAVSANVPIDALGADAGRLSGVRRRTWADTQVRLGTAGAVLDVLESRALVPAVTGGLSMVTTVSAEAGTRPLGPIDLLLGDRGPAAARSATNGADRHDPIEAAVGALEAAGWSRLHPVASPFVHVVDVGDAGGRVVRLHRWVLFPRWSDVPELGWLERAVPHELAGRAARRLRLSDELVATVLLGLLSPTAGWLRWPLDVADLSRAGHSFEQIAPDAYWSEVVTSAGDLGAGPLIGAGLAMCRAELGAHVPASVVGELLAGRWDAELAHHWKRRRAGRAAERRTVRYRRLARYSGRPATPWGYLGARSAAFRATGLRAASRVRIDRASVFIADRRRN